MKRKNQHIVQFAIFMVVVMISLLIGLVVYYHSLLASLQETTRITQAEVLRQEQYNFSKTLAADQLMLKGFAETFAIGPEDTQSLLQMLDTVQRSTDFEYASFANIDGTAISNKGDISNIADRDYFHRALSGDTVISEPLHSKIRDAYIIVAATPVLTGGQTVGVLFGSFEAKKLEAWFVNSFNGYGYTYIATNTGELIVTSNNEYALAETGNIFDLLGEAKFSEPDGYETMQKNLVDGRGGEVRYSYDGQKRLMQYDKLDTNDWNIFTVVNPREVEATAYHMLRNAILLTGTMTLVFIILLSYNLYSQKQLTLALMKMAYVDEVTGCHNFSKFKADAKELLEAHLGMSYMLIKMDVENFKRINNKCGMKAGDQILKVVAKALELALDKNLDTFGRIQADEFILLAACRDEAEQSRKRQIFETILLQSNQVQPGFDLKLPRGRCRLKAGAEELETAYEKVSFAHRLAKNSGCRELYYGGEVKERALREQEIESNMEAALQNEEFQLLLQPRYEITSEKMVGAETMVRWLSSSGKMIYSDEFIPLFEENGFVVKLDMYLFEKCCKTLGAWVDTGIPQIVVTANFSKRHLSDPHFVSALCEIADRYHVRHELLEIEFTETAKADNPAVLINVLEALRGAGFTLSLGDIGTGCSSLRLMKDIAVDVIKLNKQIFENPKDFKLARTVISSVIELAQTLAIHTVAGGVETLEQINLLRELGCEMAQGDYFAKPMPVVELEVRLLRGILLH